MIDHIIVRVRIFRVFKMALLQNDSKFLHKSASVMELITNEGTFYRI